MRATQNVLFTFIFIGALTLLGCSKSDVAPPSAAEPAGEGPGPVEEPQAAAQASSPVAKALRAAKRSFTRSTVTITEAQLDDLMATEYEIFDASEPALRIFVFHYDDAALAKPAKVARWINQSGLVHHAECTANGGHVIAIGSQSSDPLTDELRQATNDFMDAFMIGRY